MMYLPDWRGITIGGDEGPKRLKNAVAHIERKYGYTPGSYYHDQAPVGARASKSRKAKAKVVAPDRQEPEYTLDEFGYVTGNASPPVEPWPVEDSRGEDTQTNPVVEPPLLDVVEDWEALSMDDDAPSPVDRPIPITTNKAVPETGKSYELKAESAPVLLENKHGHGVLAASRAVLYDEAVVTAIRAFRNDPSGIRPAYST
jgi:hypothetical protein